MTPATTWNLDPGFRREAFHRALLALRDRHNRDLDLHHAVMLAECAADYLALSAESDHRPVEDLLLDAVTLWRQHLGSSDPGMDIMERVLRLVNDTLEDVAHLIEGRRAVLH